VTCIVTVYRFIACKMPVLHEDPNFQASHH
jgi:hypothetical protein